MLTVKRRTIGRAYEFSPAERLHGWLEDNILRVFGALAAMVLVNYAVNFIVDGVMNVAFSEGSEGVSNRFSSNDPVVDLLKLGLFLVFGYFLLFRFGNRRTM
jgi:hypothetical protein